MRVWIALLSVFVWFIQKPLLSAQESAQEDALDRSVRVIEDADPIDRPVVPKASAPLPDNADPDAKTNNSAGLNIEVLPITDVQAGEKMAFRISTRKAGFLVLVDVDSQGKLAQIYPNMLTLSDSKGIDSRANFITPQIPVTVPVAGAKANFEFVAAPPVGVGMIVAILSDKPLQIVDLPDVPTALAGQSGAADFVRENARALTIVSADIGGQIKVPKWSIATAFYGIH
jgi:hypothetical protein